MAKYKRKISATQRDKYNIAVAKILKERGIISKKAKLHSGHYISRGVLAKVKQYESAGRLGYSAVPVSKALAKRSKEFGFEVVQGNKIIGPNTREFKKRLKEAETNNTIPGVKPIKGGYKEELILPHTIYDLRTLVETLGEDGLDSLKLYDEQFGFKYKGNESYSYFPNSRILLDKLLQYKPISGALGGTNFEDEFANLVIFRAHREDAAQMQRDMDKIRQANRNLKRREFRKRIKGTLAERVRVAADNREAILAERAKAKEARKLANIRNNPARYEAYKAKRRETAKASYNRRKGK